MNRPALNVVDPWTMASLLRSFSGDIIEFSVDQDSAGFLEMLTPLILIQLGRKTLLLLRLFIILLTV